MAKKIESIIIFIFLSLFCFATIYPVLNVVGISLRTDDAFQNRSLSFIEFEEKTEEINKGEMIIVPKGIKHRPYAKTEAKIMIIEPKGVVNTGEILDKLTAPNDDWI